MIPTWLTKDTPLSKVVTRESGTRRGEEASPLDTNHFDLNKYSSETDGSYMAVRNKIKQFLRSWNGKAIPICIKI